MKKINLLLGIVILFIASCEEIQINEPTKDPIIIYVNDTTNINFIVTNGVQSIATYGERNSDNTVKNAKGYIVSDENEDVWYHVKLAPNGNISSIEFPDASFIEFSNWNYSTNKTDVKFYESPTNQTPVFNQNVELPINAVQSLNEGRSYNSAQQVEKLDKETCTATPNPVVVAGEIALNAAIVGFEGTQQVLSFLGTGLIENIYLAAIGENPLQEFSSTMKELQEKGSILDTYQAEEGEAQDIAIDCATSIIGSGAAGAAECLVEVSKAYVKNTISDQLQEKLTMCSYYTLITTDYTPNGCWFAGPSANDIVSNTEKNNYSQATYNESDGVRIILQNPIQLADGIYPNGLFNGFIDNETYFMTRELYFTDPECNKSNEYKKVEHWKPIWKTF